MPKDFPIEECVATVKPFIEAGKTQVFQKFTCARCRKRQTMDVPNIFFELGTCDECGHVTDIKKTGCNYLMVTSDPEAKQHMTATRH